MVEDTIARRVRSLTEAFVTTGLARLSVKDAGFELEVSRRVQPLAGVAQPPAVTETPAPVEPRADIVTSDLVGVLRFSRPQVRDGQQLENDRELAYVEALGIRNPVRSRGAGRVAAILVDDGQAVEYGQPLFAIER